MSSFKDDSGKIELKRLTVIFDDNVLVRTEGDYEPGRACASRPRKTMPRATPGTVDS